MHMLLLKEEHNSSQFLLKNEGANDPIMNPGLAQAKPVSQ